MDINQIRYFINLADTLNFTEAARRSHVSQPSLTRAIQKLEDELGGPLIYRDGKDSRLTALGREVQAEFMRIDALVDGVRTLAENSVSGKRVTLSIGVAPTIAPNPVSAFLAYALTELPMLALQIEPMRSGESADEVLSGRYDACILPAAPPASAKLATVPLYREALRIAMAADHPLAAQTVLEAEQLPAEPYLDRLNCEFRNQLIAHFMNRNIVMRATIASEREDWVQQLVAAGLGLCSLPERSAIVSGLALRPVRDMNLSREVTLVTISGSASPREMRHILRMARDWDWSAPAGGEAPAPRRAH